MIQYTRFKETKIVEEPVKMAGEWFAWNDLEPPAPFEFHITGSVTVPNPGVDVYLRKRIPQGINPAIILLTLEFIQRPGFWPAVITQRHVRYDETFASESEKYSSAEIFVKNTRVHTVPVVDAH